MAQAPAGAPAGSSGQCNDATYSTAGKQEGSLPRSQGRKRVVWPDGHSLNEKTGRSCFNSHWGSAPAAAAAKPSVNNAPAPGGGAGQVWLNTKTNVCRTIAYSWLAYAALFFARKFRLRLRTNASPRFSSALKSVCRVAIWMGSPAD